MKAKKIKGFENEYVVTKNGRVYRKLKSGHSELSIATNEDGYKTVVLYKDGNPKFMYVHELVASNWTNGDQSKGYVNHKDGDKSNNNADNLAYADAVENTQHAYDNGLASGPKGEKNGKSKLTKKQVGSIRKSNKSGIKLAQMHDVDPATISLIKNRHRW